VVQRLAAILRLSSVDGQSVFHAARVASASRSLRSTFASKPRTLQIGSHAATPSALDPTMALGNMRELGTERWASKATEPRDGGGFADNTKNQDISERVPH
jgi:hypothetical protein